MVDLALHSLKNCLKYTKHLWAKRIKIVFIVKNLLNVWICPVGFNQEIPLLSPKKSFDVKLLLIKIGLCKQMEIILLHHILNVSGLHWRLSTGIIAIFGYRTNTRYKVSKATTLNGLFSKKRNKYMLSLPFECSRMCHSKQQQFCQDLSNFIWSHFLLQYVLREPN